MAEKHLSDSAYSPRHQRTKDSPLPPSEYSVPLISTNSGYLDLGAGPIHKSPFNGLRISRLVLALGDWLPAPTLQTLAAAGVVNYFPPPNDISKTPCMLIHRLAAGSGGNAFGNEIYCAPVAQYQSGVGGANRHAQSPGPRRVSRTIPEQPRGGITKALPG